jgi:putative mRNA 3-end processing factor
MDSGMVQRTVLGGRHAGRIAVAAPPATLHSLPQDCRVRARARQSLVELPLVISDHADWDGLRATVTATGAGEIWVTHGQEDALVHWCGTQGLKARPLDIVGYGDEDETDGVAEAGNAGNPT